MEQQIPHPIVLEKVFFTKSIVIAIPTHEPSSETIPAVPENSIDLLVTDEPGRYLVTMRSVLNQDGSDAAPYKIEMECLGMFFADQSLSPEEAPRAVLITAHGVLYGAIREAVAWITGRQPHGQLMLGLSILQPKSPDKPT
jgi:hypothetical protein